MGALAHAGAAALALLVAACTVGRNPLPTSLPESPATDPPASTADPGVLAPRGTPSDPSAIPALATRGAGFQAVLDGSTSAPILLLDEPLAELQVQAQDLAVRDPRVQALVSDATTGAPHRAEVLGIRRAGLGDLTEATAACRDAPCYRVEVYDHARNAAVVALVDVAARKVVAVDHYPGMQPDLPPHLVSLAERIAAASPEVAEALGEQPAPSDAMMAGSKTALNETRCEASGHLCVAPTFLRGDRALWAIVDLTDGVLVGARWTSLGKSGSGPVVTERRLQEEVVSARYCERETELVRGDWSMRYLLTSSDGLRVADVRYRGKPVLDDAKLVDWHVSYSGTDAFGYSDAIGCPTFSQAAVVAHEGPSVEALSADDSEGAGFALVQDFMGDGWPAPCHYFYRQRYAFYDDGSFRVIGGNLGRGCGTEGTYRPVLRIALAGEEHTVASWDGSGWSPWAEEGFVHQDAIPPGAPEGLALRVTDPTGAGYGVVPGTGQLGEGDRGDDAYLYATLDKPGVDEGRADLITIGPCCNDDHRQGPERFIEPEPEAIAGRPIVLWYVAQLRNDATPGNEACWAESVLEGGVYVPKAYPCYAGPMLVPIEAP